MTWSRLLWLAMVMVVVAALAWALALAPPLNATALATVAFVLGYGSVGALVASRLPGHPIGWLLLAASACFSLGGLLVTQVEVAHSPDPLAVLAGNVLFGTGTGIASTFVLLFFPTGRLPSPRWKVVAWMAAIGTMFLITGVSLSPDSFDGLSTENPIALPADHPLLLLLEGGGVLLLGLAILGSVASLAVRIARGSETERRQLKWIGLAVLALAFAIFGTYAWELANGAAEVSDDLENLVIASFLALLPVAIGVAILRHRLFDIDRIISRTVSYALIIGALGLLVLGLVAGMAVFLPSDDPLVVAVATLTVAGLFNPVRHRVQRLVDRRFNRSRYDAERVVDDFSGSLRERVDPESLVADWVEVVEDTMQPSSLGIWVRAE